MLTARSAFVRGTNSRRPWQCRLIRQLSIKQFKPKRTDFDRQIVAWFRRQRAHVLRVSHATHSPFSRRFLSFRLFSNSLNPPDAELDYRLHHISVISVSFSLSPIVSHIRFIWLCIFDIKKQNISYYKFNNSFTLCFLLIRARRWLPKWSFLLLLSVYMAKSHTQQIETETCNM